MEHTAATHRQISLDDPAVYAGAVRESVHRQIMDLLERRGLIARADLIACPECGDRVILLDQPGTFVLDHDKERICAACGAARDFIRMVEPDVDVGGEGGA